MESTQRDPRSSITNRRIFTAIYYGLSLRYGRYVAPAQRPAILGDPAELAAHAPTGTLPHFPTSRNPRYPPLTSRRHTAAPDKIPALRARWTGMLAASCPPNVDLRVARVVRGPGGDGTGHLGLVGNTKFVSHRHPASRRVNGREPLPSRPPALRLRMPRDAGAHHRRLHTIQEGTAPPDTHGVSTALTRSHRNLPGVLDQALHCPQARGPITNAAIRSLVPPRHLHYYECRYDILYECPSGNPPRTAARAVEMPNAASRVGPLSIARHRQSREIPQCPSRASTI